MDCCVKCNLPTRFYRIDPSTSYYCEACFLAVAKHKFFFAFGRNRIFKRRWSQKEEHQRAAVVYDGSAAATLLLSLVRQGIASKKLPIKPVVLVLLPHPTSNNGYCDPEGDLEQRIAGVAKSTEQSGGEWTWHSVHMAAILDAAGNEAEDAESNMARGSHKIQEYCQMLTAIKSQSTRAELSRLLATLLIVRTARELGCNRILLPDNMEKLAEVAIGALCYGRGSSIPDLTSIVDSRFDGVQLIRPLRDMSDREIAATNQLENIDMHLSNSTTGSGIRREWTGSSVQKVAHDFLHGLKEDGYPATMTTILAVSAKLQTQGGGGDVARCRLCFAASVASFGCCQPCSDFLLELDESTQQTIVERVLNANKAS